MTNPSGSWLCRQAPSWRDHPPSCALRFCPDPWAPELHHAHGLRDGGFASGAAGGGCPGVLDITLAQASSCSRSSKWLTTRSQFRRAAVLFVTQLAPHSGHRAWEPSAGDHGASQTAQPSDSTESSAAMATKPCAGAEMTSSRNGYKTTI